MSTRVMRAKVKQAKGRVKEAVGVLTEDPELERKGSRQRAEGAVEESLGKARRKVGEVIAGFAKAIEK